MLKILLLGAIAMAATVPSFMVARLYLKHRQIEVASEETVEAFMEHAPTPLKVVLISLNFLLFGVGLWLLMAW